MRTFTLKAQVDLDELWVKCLVDLDEEKADFYAILESQDDPESILEHYESNVQHWQKYYQRHSCLLLKVTRVI